MYKKLFVYSLTFILVLVLAISLYDYRQRTTQRRYVKTSSTSLHFAANNLKELIDNADVIIQGTMGDVYKEYYYGDVYFTEFWINVNQVYKGEYNGNKIKVLQTETPEKAQKEEQSNIYDEMVEYNTLLRVKKGTNLLLFLEKGPSPFTDDKIAYVPLGLYQGVYIVNDDGTLSTSLKDGVKLKVFNGVVKDVVENYKTIDKVKTYLQNAQ